MIEIKIKLIFFIDFNKKLIFLFSSAGSEGGVSYNIGALYGAGFFVCAMVISLTILGKIMYNKFYTF